MENKIPEPSYIPSLLLGADDQIITVNDNVWFASRDGLKKAIILKITFLKWEAKGRVINVCIAKDGSYDTRTIDDYPQENEWISYENEVENSDYFRYNALYYRWEPLYSVSLKYLNESKPFSIQTNNPCGKIIQRIE